ncbi:MAG: hypothetical protein M3291_06950 [Actinomycetota bacterium]|nr:hypothetical protein [Actinomycetota bacterium]
MYVEDKAGTDITVFVEDEEYNAEAVVDADSDGVDETAVVQRDDGSALAFSDTDGDGRADLMTQLDATGKVTGQAEYDERTGDWIGVEPPTKRISVGTPVGEVAAGPATHDTDGDGVNDSVVVVGDGGDATIFTDVDGDGGADVATEITATGEVIVAEYVGDGEWTVVERGRITSEGSYQRADAHAGDDGWWGGADGGDGGCGDSGPAHAGSAVSVDPATGRWVYG